MMQMTSEVSNFAHTRRMTFLLKHNLYERSAEVTIIVVSKSMKIAITR